MDRRMFLRSALAVAGSAAAVVVLTPQQASAKSLMDQLKDKETLKDFAPQANAADMPAPGAEEAQYGWRRRGWGRPGWRRRGWGWRRRGWGGGRRCWWRLNRWGRRVRVCAW